MKLHLSILDKLIDLPSSDPLEIRPVLDDLGLEVKGIEGEGLKTIFTIESLANRGDHLSAFGVARELSARWLVPVKLPPLVTELSDRKTSIPVRVATEKCLRYALLEMALPKPMELRPDIESLMCGADSGERKHAMVDILNYILLEIGQPMHAFDREKVEGEIAVELTDSAVEIEALDGKTYRVPPKSLVIRDKKKILAVAGVIGCKNSMVTAETTSTLIESATFDPVTVRITARAMGISTDASYAFERGCDREAVITGLKRVVSLAQQGAGANKNCHVLGFTDVVPAVPEKVKVPLHLATLRKQLNLARLPELEITTRLKNLGFAAEVVAGDKSGPIEWRLAVPSWRVWDVKTEDDLVEEFARAYGYNRIKLELPPLDYETPPPNPYDSLVERVEGALVGGGFIEVITKVSYTGEDAALLEQLEPGVGQRHVTIKNALERSYSHLKVTNVLHLAKLSAENHRRGLLSFKVFEFGRLFSLGFTGGAFEFERDVLTMAASGRWTEHEWQKPETIEELVFLFKGVIENVVRSVGVTNLTTTAGSEPFLHPGAQAALKSGREQLGHFGIVHPLLREKLGLRQDVVVAELDVAKLIKSMAESQYRAPSDFPSIRRDLTLKLPVTTLAGKISKSMVETKPENLTDVAIVDNFRKAEEDFRRVTYRLTFQSRERTLESAEVDRAVEQILGTLKADLSIERA